MRDHSDKPTVRFGSKRFPLPRGRLARLALGTGLIAGGLVSFLPLFGAWMIPAGLMVLSVDIARVRRQRRRLDLRAARWARGVTGPAPLVRLLTSFGLRG
jgi:hypothetical protein